MKAVDYFAKYENEFFPVVEVPTVDNINKTVTDVIYDFAIEISDIQEKRKAVTSNAMTAIVKEQNQKWNALCRLFEKKYKVSPLRRDGFMYVWRIANNKT